MASRKTLVLKHKKLIAILGIFLIGMLVVTSAPAMTNSIVTPGWEIYDQICGIRCPAGIKTGAGEFTYPNEIGAAQWKVDIDSPNYGVPTLMIQTSDIRHVDFTGTATPNESPAQTRTVTRNNHTYYLDYHIYMFDVTIRTVADRVQVNTGWTGVPQWEHETSWGLQSTAFPTDSNKVGKPFQGGAYVKFVISPWRGGTTHTAPNSSYVIQGAWSGVMNSYIQNKQQGQIENQWGDKLNPTVGEADMSSIGGLDNGAQVNMYQDTANFGMQAPTVNWDLQVTPDTRIPSTVVLYLPAQLTAGAYLSKRIFDVMALTPCDVYVKYTVRVDVLQTHDFVLQTAYEPPELTPPIDFFSWAYSLWDSPTTQAILWLLAIVLIALAFFYVYMKNRKRGSSN